MVLKFVPCKTCKDVVQKKESEVNVGLYGEKLSLPEKRKKNTHLKRSIVLKGSNSHCWTEQKSFDPIFSLNNCPLLKYISATGSLC